MKNPIIFSDLDGTLLDFNKYSFDAAVPALNLLKKKNIPLIICSSKTAREIEYYRIKLENHHPFISENGGGIFIPKNYFNFDIKDSKYEIIEKDNYLVISLGAPYSDLRKAIKELRNEGYKVRGFGDMSVHEIAEISNMSINEAEMSKERDFDEPFIFEYSEEEKQSLFQKIMLKGFHYTIGRFFHILGNTDKGLAVSILTDLYRRFLKDVTTIAIGDSPNDIPMLEMVEYPFIVQRPDKRYSISEDIVNLKKVDGIGPEGWNKAIIALLSEDRNKQ